MKPNARASKYDEIEKADETEKRERS